MRYLGLLILLPYIVGFTPADSTYSESEFGVGGGQYTYSDCSGAHKRNFIDGGVRATHKFAAPFRIGVTAGVFPSGDRTGILFYPDLAVDNGSLSLGTTGVRIGSLSSTFFEIKGLDEVPFSTGRGAFRIGMGLTFKETGSHIWLGANTVPYQNWGPAIGFECKLVDGEFLFLNGRYSEHNSVPEYGLSIGLRLRY